MATAPALPTGVPSNVRPYTIEGGSLRARITATELVDLVKAGQLILCAEYRSTKIDKVSYVDKKTGKPETFLKVEHHVEADLDGNGQTCAFVCEERQDRGVVEPAQVHIGLKKGQTVALRLQSIRREKGSVIASVTGIHGVAVLE
jgi:hypothetical protein